MPTRNQTKNNSNKKGLPKWVLYASIALIVLLAISIYLISRFNNMASAKPTSTPTAVLPAEIPVEEAYLLFGLSSVTFVDVRSADDWEAFHIDKSISIPLAEFSQRYTEISKKNTIIVVDSLGEDDSVEARTTLEKAGYSSVTILAGGIDAWVQKRYPLIGTGRY